MPHEKRRSLRARMITLVLVPSTALLLLWAAFTATLSVNISQLRTTAALTEEVGTPIIAVITQLQSERRATMDAVTEDEAEVRQLEDSRGETDAAIDTLEESFDEFDRDLPGRATNFRSWLDRLDSHRERIDSYSVRERSLENTGDFYTELVENGLQFWDSQVERADQEQAAQLRSLVSLMRSRELLNQQDSILGYAVTTETFTRGTHSSFAAAVGAQHYTWDRVGTELAEEDGEAGAQESETDLLLQSFPALRQVYTVQESIIRLSDRGADSSPTNVQNWWDAATSADLRMRTAEEEEIAHVLEFSEQQSAELFRGVLAGSLLALAAALASTLVAVAGTQRLGRRLQALRTATLEHARVRLPEVTKRLRSGGSVDVDTEVPRLRVDRTDEIGQVTEAFNDAQRAAVVAAVEESQLRTGVRNMFRNIARRTQALVHRQLGLLDSLERNETDPKVLESLFRIDHFSTQMRRNAENLMLLSGDTPVRRGLAPVRLHEAVRGAASEIEDYTRVRVLPLSNAALRGEAGADTVRLLAELLENAAAFSPPGTRVTVSGEELAEGYYSLVVEDRGLGMTEEQRERANTLLADPPRFDLALVREDSQLGLFVVATIAARHGFEVRVQPSPFGGTRAVVLIPPGAFTDAQQEQRSQTGPQRSARASRATRPASGLPTGGTGTARAVSRPRNEESEGTLGPSPALTEEQARTRERAEEETERHAKEPFETYMGLPRRRRRQVASAPAPVEDRGATGEQRSLSQIQSMMSAFQSGTQRGRAESEGPEVEGGARDARHGENSEG